MQNQPSNQAQSPPNPLPTDPQRLDLARIHTALVQCEIGHTVEYAPSMPSTMLPAHAFVTHAARQDATDPETAHGVVVTTEAQTAGRGRRGRVWVARPGQSLLVSVVLASPTASEHLARLPMLAGLAALAAVGHVAPQLRAVVGLKWPNDLVMRRHLAGAPQDAAPVAKFGGILLESVYRHDATGAPRPYAVAGFGINVNQDTSDLPEVEAPALPPTSLRLATGDIIDRTDLLIALCTSLGDHLARLRTPSRAARAQARQALVTEWRDRLLLMGEPIQVYPHTGAPYPAVAQDVTEIGQLIVRDEQGSLHTLVADDVSIRPPQNT